MSALDKKTVLAKTIYAEARGESLAGQKGVAHVIFNRADAGWGGGTVEGVCRQDGQFECWIGKSDIAINEHDTYKTIKGWTDKLCDMSPKDRKEQDNTRGSDHYNNPDKEGFHFDDPGRYNVVRTVKIGDHQFYKTKK